MWNSICIGVHNELVYQKTRELMEDLAIEASKTLLVCFIAPAHTYVLLGYCEGFIFIPQLLSCKQERQC
jgi:hypothetical protein